MTTLSRPSLKRVNYVYTTIAERLFNRGNCTRRVLIRGGGTLKLGKKKIFFGVEIKIIVKKGKKRRKRKEKRNERNKNDSPSFVLSFVHDCPSETRPRVETTF